MCNERSELTINSETAKRKIIDLSAMAAWIGIPEKELLRNFELNACWENSDKLRELLASSATDPEDGEKFLLFCRAAHFFLQDAPISENPLKGPTSHVAESRPDTHLSES